MKRTSLSLGTTRAEAGKSNVLPIVANDPGYGELSIQGVRRSPRLTLIPWPRAE